MGFLDRFLGKKKDEPRDEGIYFYVRCARCARVLHTRLDPQRELSPLDEGGFEVHKEMMDDRCFRRITLDATFDKTRRVGEVSVDGGTLIDRVTWEAERHLPRRAPSPSEEEG